MEKFSSGDFGRALAAPRKSGGRPKTDLEKYTERRLALKSLLKGSETEQKMLGEVHDLRVKLLAEKQLGSSPLVNGDGAVLEWPGEEPVVGDELLVVQPDGTSAPAPDGTHQTESGLQITTEGGVITAVAPVEAQTSDPSKAPEPASDPAPVAASQVSDAEIQRLVAEQVKAQLSKKLSGRAFSATGVKAGPALLSHQGDPDKGEVLRGIEMLLGSRSRSRKIREQFSVTTTREMYLSVGSDVTGLVTRSLNSLGDLLFQVSQYTGVLSFVRQINTGVYEQIATAPDRPIDIDLPRVAVTDVAFRKYTEGCTVDPQGVIQATRRILRAWPSAFEMDVCAEDFSGLFNGVIYINDERIPAESVVLSIVLERLNYIRERMLFNGNRGTVASDVFDGLDVLFAADTERTAFAAQVDVALTAPNATNAVEQVQALLNLLPLEVHNVHSQKLHYLFVPRQTAEFYFQDFLNTYSAAAGSNIYDDYVRPIQLTSYNVQMVPVESMVGINRMYLVPEDALYFAQLKESTWSRQLPDNGRIRTTIKAHMGLQYAFGTEIIRGTW